MLLMAPSAVWKNSCSSFSSGWCRTCLSSSEVGDLQETNGNLTAQTHPVIKQTCLAYIIFIHTQRQKWKAHIQFSFLLVLHFRVFFLSTLCESLWRRRSRAKIWIYYILPQNNFTVKNDVYVQNWMLMHCLLHSINCKLLTIYVN